MGCCPALSFAVPGRIYAVAGDSVRQQNTLCKAGGSGRFDDPARRFCLVSQSHFRGHMPDLLFATDDNPMPEGTISGRARMRDGVEIRYAIFPATGRPLKGTVILLSGRNESIEKYYETARDLCARGFGVFTFDWRGQGGSSRLIRNTEKGFVRSFGHYVADLDQLFGDVVLPDCRAPFFILAHSTGALVALLAAPAMVNRVRRMVLTAPLLDFRHAPLSRPSLRRLTGLARLLGLGRLYLGGGPRPRVQADLTGSKLTSDPARYRRNLAIYAQNPELGIGGPTVAWVNAALRAMRQVADPDFAARIHIPLLLIAAGADEVVSTPAIEAYSRRLRSGSLLTIDGAQHELLQEADRYREQVLAAFDAFVPGSG